MSKTKTKTKMKLKIEHQVPGRVRMKIPAGKNNPELLKQISEVFAAIPGLEHITADPKTGSVVLHYDTDRHHEFHGSLQQHFVAHDQRYGIADTGRHGAPTELDSLTNKIEAEAEYLAQHSHSMRAIVDSSRKPTARSSSSPTTIST